MFKKHESSENSTPASLRPGGSTGSSLELPSSSAKPAAKSTASASIGPSIRINGDIAGNEDLVIHGQVAGSISLPNNMLTVGKEGSIDADVSAKAVDIEGKVSGTVQAAEIVRVQPAGYVKGDIAAPRVVLEDGCQFRGGIDMQEQQVSGSHKQNETQSKSNGSGNPSKPHQDRLKANSTAKA